MEVLLSSEGHSVCLPSVLVRVLNHLLVHLLNGNVYLEVEVKGHRELTNERERFSRTFLLLSTSTNITVRSKHSLLPSHTHTHTNTHTNHQLNELCPQTGADIRVLSTTQDKVKGHPAQFIFSQSANSIAVVSL